MKRYLPLMTAIAALTLFVGAALADFVPGAGYTATPISAANTTASTINAVSWPARLSAQGMLDTGYIESTALASHMIGGAGSGPYADTNEQPYMPGTLASPVLGYYVYDEFSNAYTNYTTEANGAGGALTVDGTPAVGDAVLIGFYNQAQLMRFMVSTASTGYAWGNPSFCNQANCNPETSAHWTALPSLVTTGLPASAVGLSTQSWTLGYSTSQLWDLQALNGLAVSAYWIRYSLTSVGTIAPIFQQVSWENYQWWTFTESLESAQQVTYTLYTRPTTDTDDLTYHQFFTGPTGLTTTDHASIEPGGDYEFEIEGYWDVTTGTSKCAFIKASAVSLCPFSSTQYRFTNNGAINLDFNISSGHHTVRIVHSGATTEAYVDGALAASAGDMDVTDNGNAWVWMADGTSGAYKGAMPYFDYISLDVGGVNRLLYQLETTPGASLPTSALPDNSGNGNNATLASYPRVPPSGQPSVTIAPSQAVSDTGFAGGAGPAVQPAATPIPTGEGTGTDQLGYDILSGILGANTAQLPIQAFYLIGSMLLMILLAFTAYKITGGNLLAAIMVPVLAGAAFAFSGGGAIPFGILIVVTIAGLGLLVANREGVI